LLQASPKAICRWMSSFMRSVQHNSQIFIKMFHYFPPASTEILMMGFEFGLLNKINPPDSLLALFRAAACTTISTSNIIVITSAVQTQHQRTAADILSLIWSECAGVARRRSRAAHSTGNRDLKRRERASEASLLTFESASKQTASSLRRRFTPAADAKTGNLEQFEAGG